MSKRLNIGVDVDGVLADFTGTARKLCQLMFDGRPADNLQQTEWDFDCLGITKKELNKMWRQIDNTENWWLSLGVLPNTSFLKPLHDTHRVVFITNRKDGEGWPIEEQTSEWLRYHFHIFSPNVIISDNKGPVVRGLKLDYFIDDRDKNVKEVLDAAPDCSTYMRRWPSNPNFQKGFPLIVDSFNEFAEPLLKRSINAANRIR